MIPEGCIQHCIICGGSLLTVNARKILAPVIGLGPAVAGGTRPVPPTYSSLSDDNLQASVSLGNVVDDGIDDSDADDRGSMEKESKRKAVTTGATTAAT